MYKHWSGGGGDETERGGFLNSSLKESNNHAATAEEAESLLGDSPAEAVICYPKVKGLTWLWSYQMWIREEYQVSPAEIAGAKCKSP